MAGSKKPTTSIEASYTSLYVNPLPSTHRNYSSDRNLSKSLANDVDKENAVPTNSISLAQNQNGSSNNMKKPFSSSAIANARVLKPSSLQLCMQMNEPDRVFNCKIDSDIGSTALSIWDYSDSEVAPASSWSTLPNRALLCRPLPLDVGRCTCVIIKEALPDGLAGGTLYSLHTHEGHGRHDRKLAIAHHKRHNGKSEFTVAQNLKGVLSRTDDSYIGNVTASLMGSKYHIWDQGGGLNSSTQQCNKLLAAITFMPTIATWTGSFRSMRVYIPKHQSLQLKNTTQVQHVNSLPSDWQGKLDRVHKLYSRAPNYNKISRQHELDFREKVKAGFRIQSSVKNFQLTLQENGKQTILQLGKVGKSKFVIDFRYPLTGYHAFCICLASIDSKLCCTV